MRNWGPWDWISYVSLAAAAVVMAAKGLDTIPSMTWLASTFWSFVPAALVVLATLIFILKNFGWVGSRFVSSAKLQLQIYGDDRIPLLTAQENIFRWYQLRMIQSVKEPTRTVDLVITVLIIGFLKPVKVGTLRVDANVALPRHETKEFNSRFAVIGFIGQLPASLLTVLVE